MILRYALDHLAKNQALKIYERYLIFEKKHGEVEGIEEVICNKRRFQYEEEAKKNPLNYDIWFDYIRLEENTSYF